MTFIYFSLRGWPFDLGGSGGGGPGVVFFFSSPKPKAHWWTYSIGRHPSSSSVTNIFKRHLWSCGVDSYHISLTASIGGDAINYAPSSCIECMSKKWAYNWSGQIYHPFQGTYLSFSPVYRQLTSLKWSLNQQTNNGQFLLLILLKQ